METTNDNNFVLFNDGTIPYHNIYFSCDSSIDLSMCS